MKKPILIIEGEPWLGDQYQRVLEAAGFSIVRTSNAYSAIDLIDDTIPRVIVLSLLLSGTNGVGLLHELQSYVDTAKIPIVVCGDLIGINSSDLEPYGVKRVIDTTSMEPTDLVTAVKAVLA